MTGTDHNDTAASPGESRLRRLSRWRMASAVVTVLCSTGVLFLYSSLWALAVIAVGVASMTAAALLDRRIMSVGGASMFASGRAES